jgi:hypothetical protein
MRVVCALVGAVKPVRIRVEQEEENHAEHHEITVDAEDDASVIPTPGGSHAADGICRAKDGGEEWQKEKGCSTIMGKVCKDEGECKRQEDEKVGPRQGTFARIEDGR